MEESTGTTDDPSRPINVLVYGLGAVGAFYAFILQRTPKVKLTVVARSNFETVKQRGFTIKSYKHHGEHAVRPHSVLKNPADAADVHFDYVVCAAKAIDQDAIAEDLSPVISENTTIVIIQNGLGNEDAFRAAYPECTILSGVTWISATQTSAGVIEHYNIERMDLGTFARKEDGGKNYDAGKEISDLDKTRFQHFASLLSAGKTPLEITDDIQRKRWEKIVWNVAWNSLTALTMLDTQAWLATSAESLNLTRQVMEEVVAVAEACAVPIPAKPSQTIGSNTQGSHTSGNDFVEALVEKTLKLPGIRSSMMVDRELGRPMEVELIVGTPVKKARQHGVPIPRLEMLYALLLATNAKSTKEN